MTISLENLDKSKISVARINNFSTEVESCFSNGAISSVLSSNLTANKVAISDNSGKISNSSITTTQLGYLSDVTSNIQAQINGISGAVPVGSIIPYAGSSAPSGYLLCDGSAISRTTYSALFTAIGTTYGEGDGNTTFNIPTWSTVITAVSIPSTIAVYGNGKTMGLTDGTNNYGLKGGVNDKFIAGRKDTYGTSSGTANSGASEIPLKTTIGLTTDTSGKSGIVAKSNSITRTSKSFKFCIKY